MQVLTTAPRSPACAPMADDAQDNALRLDGNSSGATCRSGWRPAATAAQMGVSWPSSVLSKGGGLLVVCRGAAVRRSATAAVAAAGAAAEEEAAVAAAAWLGQGGTSNYTRTQTQTWRRVSR